MKKSWSLPIATMGSQAARLDRQPELLFTLRNVDHAELIGIEVEVPKRRAIAEPPQSGGARRKKVARAPKQKRARRVVKKSKR